MGPTTSARNDPIADDYELGCGVAPACEAYSVRFSESCDPRDTASVGTPTDLTIEPSQRRLEHTFSLA